MKIGVLTDSSAYLTPQQCADNGIKVIPIPIIWNKQVYHDMVNIGFHEFYEKLATASTLPSTSQPSIGDIQKYVDSYVEAGYTDLIIVTISSGLSGFYDNVLSIAKTEKRINIHPFDSKITCAGQANAALLAGKLVKKGADIDLIMHDLEDLRNTTDVRFVVDNLQHLKRTGRLSNAASFVGSLLRITPILSMDVQDKGKISAISKERKYQRAYNRIQQDFTKLITDLPYPVQLTIFHADDIERETAWLEDYEEKFPQVEINSSIIGPVVGTHVGQHTIAMIWSRNINSYFDQDGQPLPASEIHSPIVED
ncbi:DegV family protein [Lactobacillus sp. PV012]|uniref:DegV family protein n=1 Tax=Lactobacillus sp. PV012 TaxID=2594494 RepID=UPI002240C2DD|nr:DegV family protein [Lactobacillus sp. PV012]QNQ82285.1 DegV family protein [Lactobacillus sp. PV012]